MCECRCIIVQKYTSTLENFKINPMGIIPLSKILRAFAEAHVPEFLLFGKTEEESSVRKHPRIGGLMTQPPPRVFNDRFGMKSFLCGTSVVWALMWNTLLWDSNPSCGLVRLPKRGGSLLKVRKPSLNLHGVLGNEDDFSAAATPARIAWKRVILSRQRSAPSYCNAISAVSLCSQEDVGFLFAGSILKSVAC